MKDSTITSHLSSRKPINLNELSKFLDGGCEISFFEFLKSFAITSIDLKSAEIEFGLTHGCEVMRGHFTSFIIKLPISDELKNYLKE